MRRNNIVSLVMLLSIAAWYYQEQIKELIPGATADVAIIAFVIDNDAPDVDLNVEVTKAVAILRETHDVVVKVDDTPTSISQITQGPAVVAEAEKLGGNAIVLIGADNSIVKVFEIAPTSKADEMVRLVNGS